MRRIAFVLISAIATVVLTATAALAGSPHFLFVTNSVSGTTGALTTSFKDAGLGTGTTSIQITLTVSNATAVYQCFNNGGNHPKAGNKETVSAALSTTGTFPVRNGQTTASLTVGRPAREASPAPRARRCSRSRRPTPAPTCRTRPATHSTPGQTRSRPARSTSRSYQAITAHPACAGARGKMPLRTTLPRPEAGSPRACA